MSNSVESLFSGNKTTIIAKVGHEPRIYTVGWGEPPTYYSECTCGWRGRTIETNVPEMLIAPLKELVRLHGDEAVLGPDAVFGTGRSAVREVLAHLDLPLDKIISSTRKEINELSSNLGTAEAWRFDSSGALQKKLADLDLLIKVKVFMEIEPLATRAVPFDESVYVEVQKAIQSLHIRIPESDAEVAEVLRDLGIDG